MTVAEVCHKATAAAAFLDIARLPFAISGVQVDGGSEFMAGIEQACADKDLALTSRRRRRLNGVERCNGAWRYEFCLYELPRRFDQLRLLGDAFADLYNRFRPHGAFGGKAVPRPPPSPTDPAVSYVLSPTPPCQRREAQLCPAPSRP